jgi:hypothetical protein
MAVICWFSVGSFLLIARLLLFRLLFLLLSFCSDDTVSFYFCFFFDDNPASRQFRFIFVEKFLQPSFFVSCPKSTKNSEKKVSSSDIGSPLPNLQLSSTTHLRYGIASFLSRLDTISLFMNSFCSSCAERYFQGEEPPRSLWVSAVKSHDIYDLRFCYPTALISVLSSPLLLIFFSGLGISPGECYSIDSFP